MTLAHAEALADAMGDIVLQSIATKSDLREVDSGLLSEMKEIRSELKDMELRLTLRVAAMLVFFVAVPSALKIFA